MAFEDRCREAIVKNPKSFPFYLLLACEQDNLIHLKRAQSIRLDLLSNLPLNFLQRCVRGINAARVHKEIYQSQIYFGPKASLFFGKAGPIMTSDGETNVMNLFIKPDMFQALGSQVKRRMDKLISSKRDTSNSSVIILAKDPKIVKKSVLDAISNPIICCWHVASGKRMGELENFGHVTLYHGHENTVERLFSALDFIETDYIFIIGDDDFVFDQFLKDGEKLLDRFSGLGAVCGIGVDASHSYHDPGSPRDGSNLKLIRMSENPISGSDVKMRVLEWALFGGLSWNCLLRKKDLLNILQFRPPPKMGAASEYFVDICLILLGASLRVNKYSIIRSRKRGSDTYTLKPPVLETASSTSNVLREISERVLAFCHATKLEIDDSTIEWVVAYGSSRRFFENTAFNEGITTLPKALAAGQAARFFPRASDEYDYLVSIAAVLFEDEICVKENSV